MDWTYDDALELAAQLSVEEFKHQRILKEYYKKISETLEDELDKSQDLVQELQSQVEELQDTIWDITEIVDGIKK